MSSTIQPPDWLTDEAKEIFLETVKALGPQALPSDRSAIADFAQAQADCEAWASVVRWEGEVITSAIGNRYVNPLYTNLQSRRKDLERYRDDLGMTPKARKVTVKAPVKAGLRDAMKT